MSKKLKPSCNPQNITTHDWYYEGRGGIQLIHEETYDDGSVRKTVTIPISWRKLMASAKRCGKLSKRRRALKEGK